MRFVVAGLLGYPVVVFVLARSPALGFGDAFFLGSLIWLLPVLSIGQAALGRGVVVGRVPAYVNSGISILIIGVLSLFLGERLLGLSDLGLRTPLTITDVVWTAALLAAGIATLFAFHAIRRLTGIEETEFVHELMPVTAKEKSLFSVLSLLAGFGEEMAYRGYGITALVLATGSTSFALVLTSATFGILHAYQGPIGVVRTGVVGLTMGGAYIYSGSLWPPILAHAAIDLVAGLFLKDRLLS